MIEVKKIDVWGFGHAIRGARNPLNSWEKSDSYYCLGAGELGCGYMERCQGNCCCDIGENDMDLMRRLYKAGSEHRKYLRQIFISMDITAPLYWWKEFDTYKVGTTANSCSTMHTIHKKEFELDDFSHEHLIDSMMAVLYGTVCTLNHCRDKFLETKNKEYWWQMIQLLPSSYNQKRTLTMSYENAVNMIHQRKAHKLDEWREFVGILMELPYMKEILNED